MRSIAWIFTCHKLYIVFRLKIVGSGNQELEMAAVTAEGANTRDGTKLLSEEQGRTDSPAAAKVVGKKKYRSRSASASSQDSYSSSGSYSGTWHQTFKSLFQVILHGNIQRYPRNLNLIKNLEDFSNLINVYFCFSIAFFKREMRKSLSQRNRKWKKNV